MGDEQRGCTKRCSSSQRIFSDEEIINYYLGKKIKAQKKDKSNLFVWRKKIEQDFAITGVLPPLFQDEKKRQREIMEEKEKLKKQKEKKAFHHEEEEKRMREHSARLQIKGSHEFVLQELAKKVAAAKQTNVTDITSVEDHKNMEVIKGKKAMGGGGIEEGDVVLGSGAEVQIYNLWCQHEKYSLRKPKYFNHFHTGYHWNKYNQTHYDHDNPPPKMVQGYKFNIFYPDLVDRTKTPIYTIEKDERSSGGETCLVRFHSGPPYYDIAFRIVNDEWEYSYKKGFKCMFVGGVLRLYFNFKHFRYRR